MQPYDSSNSYDGNEWATGIPWWWRSAPLFQTVMNCCEGIPNFFIMMGLWSTMPFLIGASFAESPWFFIPMLLVGIPLVCFTVAELRAGWRVHNERNTLRGRARDLRVNEYRALPAKYRRQLKPAAKLVDHPMCSLKDEEQWRELIDDLFELHGETSFGSSGSEKESKKAVNAMTKLRQETKQQKEEAAIAKQIADEQARILKELEKEIEEKVRANFASQQVDLKGVEKLDG